MLKPADDRTGGDVFIGGDGRDEVTYAESDVGTRVSLDGVANDGRTCPQQCEGDNVDATIENITGSGGPDTLIGNAESNTVNAGQGTDVVRGEDGGDIVLGQAGTDFVDGGAGDDWLSGGGEDDALDGGADVDECRGDPGVDTAANCETVVAVP